MSNVVWKLRRRQQLSADSAVSALRDLEHSDIRYAPTVPLLPRARAIAEALDHAVYDCLYLAVAEAARAPVVTADRRLYDRASAGGWRDHVLWIEDLPAP